jgi:hypothetical protein
MRTRGARRADLQMLDLATSPDSDLRVLAVLV